MSGGMYDIAKDGIINMVVQGVFGPPADNTNKPSYSPHSNTQQQQPQQQDQQQQYQQFQQQQQYQYQNQQLLAASRSSRPHSYRG